MSSPAPPTVEQLPENLVDGRLRQTFGVNELPQFALSPFVTLTVPIAQCDMSRVPAPDRWYYLYKPGPPVAGEVLLQQIAAPTNGMIVHGIAVHNDAGTIPGFWIVHDDIPFAPLTANFTLDNLTAAEHWTGSGSEMTLLNGPQRALDAGVRWYHGSVPSAQISGFPGTQGNWPNQASVAWTHFSDHGSRPDHGLFVPAGRSVVLYNIVPAQDAIFGFDFTIRPA